MHVGLLGIWSYMYGPNFRSLALLVIYKIENIEILYGKIVIFDEIFLNNQSTWKQSGDVTFSQSIHISNRRNRNLPAAAVVANKEAYEGTYSRHPLKGYQTARFVHPNISLSGAITVKSRLERHWRSIRGGELFWNCLQHICSRSHEKLHCLKPYFAIW